MLDKVDSRPFREIIESLHGDAESPWVPAGGAAGVRRLSDLLSNAAEDVLIAAGLTAVLPSHLPADGPAWYVARTSTDQEIRYTASRVLTTPRLDWAFEMSTETAASQLACLVADMLHGVRGEVAADELREPLRCHIERLASSDRTAVWLWTHIWSPVKAAA